MVDRQRAVARGRPVVTTYVRRAADLVHALDPSRPVALAIHGYPSALCKADKYAPLDLLGVNDYFGWYPGPAASCSTARG